MGRAARQKRERAQGAAASSPLPPWTPFARIEMESIDDATLADPAYAAILDEAAQRAGVSREQIGEILRNEETKTIYRNSRYVVIVALERQQLRPDRLIYHVTIRRNDHRPLGEERYRDVMRIKRELFSPDHQAVEIYPADADEIDTSNRYHVWIFPKPDQRLPFGMYGERRIFATPIAGAKQRPFEEDLR